MRAVDIPPKDKHRAQRSRDRLAQHAKIIRAVDQQTKTISMPNAVANAVRLKDASVFMLPPCLSEFSNVFLNRSNRCKKALAREWIVPMMPGFL
ncbi:hypothetical protein [Caballeronia udeis]|uniref:hypothetical protein n=1 Tax=Caballeronia udeis TaxID=1232866 RepID=UPI0012E6F4F9|nr:hypothetical protein [Caballeronia udeis]